MKQFYDFLDSINEVNPTLVEGVKQAHKIIYEGLGTEMAVDEADMKLEEKSEPILPVSEPSIDDDFNTSLEEVPVDSIDDSSGSDDMAIEGEDLSTPDDLPVIDDGIEEM